MILIFSRVAKEVQTTAHLMRESFSDFEEQVERFPIEIEPESIEEHCQRLSRGQFETGGLSPKEYFCRVVIARLATIFNEIQVSRVDIEVGLHSRYPRHETSFRAMLVTSHTGGGW